MFYSPIRKDILINICEGERYRASELEITGHLVVPERRLLHSVVQVDGMFRQRIALFGALKKHHAENFQLPLAPGCAQLCHGNVDSARDDLTTAGAASEETVT